MAYSIDISLLEFSGPRGEILSPSTVNIFVGPNNSGKSKALREIESWSVGDDPDFKVLKSLAAQPPSNPSEILGILQKNQSEPPENQSTSLDHMWVSTPSYVEGRSELHVQHHLPSISQQVTSGNFSFIRQIVGRFLTIRLDGRTRFQLTDKKPSSDLQGRSKHHLHALYRNATARKEMRRLTYDAFGLYFTIDLTGLTHFRIRMSKVAPPSVLIEQGNQPSAISFHSNAELIEDLSDGVKSYVGLTSAVLSLDHTTLLIDEPEAFLHPPLARKLGKELSSITQKRGAKLFVATHSSEFLMGCVESGVDISIIRFDRRLSGSRYWSVSSSRIQQIMKVPLLRSVQALRGLFHHAVVVAESDADRIFYEEINYRLGDQEVPDSLFLNAQNWQTISRVVGPLREMGVAAVGVMDLDSIAQTQNWTEIYGAFGFTPIEATALHSERLWLRSALQAKGKLAYKSQGLSCLSAVDAARGGALLKAFAMHGLFIVPVGELEKWLRNLGVPSGNKSSWLTKILDQMGGDPSLSNYVKPTQGDVWDFVRSMAVWARSDPRLGVD